MKLWRILKIVLIGLLCFALIGTMSVVFKRDKDKDKDKEEQTTEAPAADPFADYDFAVLHCEETSGNQSVYLNGLCYGIVKLTVSGYTADDTVTYFDVNKQTYKQLSLDYSSNKTVIYGTYGEFDISYLTDEQSDLIQFQLVDELDAVVQCTCVDDNNSVMFTVEYLLADPDFELVELNLDECLTEEGAVVTMPVNGEFYAIVDCYVYDGGTCSVAAYGDDQGTVSGLYNRFGNFGEQCSEGSTWTFKFGDTDSESIYNIHVFCKAAS